MNYLFQSRFNGSINHFILFHNTRFCSYCSRHKKTCSGQPCTTPRPTTPPTAPALDQPVVCVPGWSEWMSNDQPIPGKKETDVEPLPSLQQFKSVARSVKGVKVGFLKGKNLLEYLLLLWKFIMPILYIFLPMNELFVKVIAVFRLVEKSCVYRLCKLGWLMEGMVERLPTALRVTALDTSGINIILIQWKWIFEESMK